MSVFNYPIPKLCLAVIGGILCYGIFEWKPNLVLSGFLLGILILGILYFFKKDRNQFFTFMCLAVAFLSGVGCAALHDPLLNRSHYAHLPSGISSSVICGVVSDRLRPGIMGERYYLNAENIDGKKTIGKLLLYVKDSSGEKLQTGDRILFRSEIKNIRKPLNPGQFNYAGYLKHKQILSSVSTSRSDLVVMIQKKKDIFYYADQLRNTIDTRLAGSHFGKNELAVLNALILGQQQDISKDILTDYQFAGAVHILSVSGLHIGFLMLFLRFFFNLLPNTQFTKFAALISTLIILWLFAIVAGLSASVVRSVVMFSFLAVALHSNRDYSGFHGLFISMLLILWVQPDFLYDAGFQLSYLALLFILWFQPLLNKTWQPKNGTLKSLRNLISVSIAAQLGTLPLSLYYFHQFPGLFLLTNLLIVPAVGIIMAIGSLAVGWAIFADVPYGILWLAQNSIRILNKTINLIASMDTARFTEIYFPITLLITSYIFLFFLVWWWEKPDKVKLICGLTSLLLLQNYLVQDLVTDSGCKEFLVFHASRKSILAERSGRDLTFYSDSEVPKNMLSDYVKLHQSLSVKFRPIRHLMVSGKRKILVIDSIGKYPKAPKPDVVVLTGSPKINIDRMLTALGPGLLIADGGNYPSFTKRVAESCKKQKIPFHATAEKGSFTISF